jgi:protein SSD1
MKAMQRAQYIVAGRNAEKSYSHYVLNVPLYTHFANPSRRYADIIVHRQLEAVLSDGAVEYTDDVESLAKTAEHCNNKKDSAMTAQEQSVHIEACRAMDKKRQQLGADLISEGIVICVYESAFDVLIPEYGFEKRVHCDQLPLKKAEFDKNQRVLELYWDKGIPSSAYIPEDERPKTDWAQRRAREAASSSTAAAAAERAARERHEERPSQTEAGTVPSDEVEALFEDEDEQTSEAADMMAGVSLNSPSDNEHHGHSEPTSPMTDTATSEDAPKPAESYPKASTDDKDAPEAKLSDKEKYSKYFSLREENGHYIQDVREMTRVPVILKTDLTKSPPYVFRSCVLSFA